ncbi:MAG: EamA family transporter [Candidatus Methylomirabilales bacterium]
MSTPVWTIVFVLVAAFLAAVGQLYFKWGAASVSVDLWSWLINWHLIVGLALHGVGFILLVTALKYGNLSILYPILATSYIWVALLSIRFLGEPFTMSQWVGVTLILGGISPIVR